MKQICYSCLDQIHFQLHGQTNRYWEHAKENTKRFIAEYEDFGRPLIHCELCDNRVRYTRSEDGKWSEESEETE